LKVPNPRRVSGWWCRKCARPERSLGSLKTKYPSVIGFAMVLQRNWESQITGLETCRFLHETRRFSENVLKLWKRPSQTKIKYPHRPLPGALKSWTVRTVSPNSLVLIVEDSPVLWFWNMIKQPEPGLVMHLYTRPKWPCKLQTVGNPESPGSLSSGFSGSLILKYE
jgi:hypothetical protein